MKKMFIGVWGWIKTRWLNLRPGRQAWFGASLGLLFGGWLVWVVVNLVMWVPGMQVWAFLINIFVPPLIVLVAAGLVYVILAWISIWPKFFRWAFITAIVLLTAPFALLVRFDLAMPIGGVVLLLIFAWIGAGISVLLKTGWSALNPGRKVILVIGLSVGVLLLAAGLTWIVLPGGENPPIVNAALQNLDTVKPLDEPDPSYPGDYTVTSFTYGTGTDMRRLEYGDDVKFESGSVDGTVFVQGWEGLSGWVLRQYWGFDLKSLPLNGRVWMPEGEGPFPLVLVVHGNHRQEDFSDGGYDYLGELLASRGMILVSVDQNFLNGTWTSLFDGEENRNENDARAWLLLEHFKLWKQWNLDCDHPLYQKVDWDNLALIGHSRGGEAVAEAALFNRLPAYPDNAKVKFNYNFPIQAVVAIAPVDAQYNPGGWKTPLTDVNYLVLHGSMDGDVTSFDGMGQYNRLQFSEEANNYKAAVYIHGANHGQFNTAWGISDAGPGLGQAFLNTKSILPAAEQEKAASVFISAFLESALKGKTEYLAVFRDWRFAQNWLPETIYVTQYADARFNPVATFEEDLNIKTTSIPNAEIHNGFLKKLREGTLKGKWNQDLSTSVVRIGWDQRGKENTAPFYLIKLGSEAATTSEEDYLVFSMGDTGDDPDEENVENYPELSVTDGFNLSVVLSSGQEKAVVTLDEIMLLQPQIRVNLAKVGFLDEESSEVVLQRYYIPLQKFTENNPNFDPSSIDKINFVFDQSPYGWIFLDDIGFWSPE